MAAWTKPENSKRKFDKTKPVKTNDNTKIKFSDHEEEPAETVNKRIVFDDEGDEAAVKVQQKVKKQPNNKVRGKDIDAKWYEEVG